ncbi:MAG: hypothetical protein AB8B91_16640 [Rubripirellula sp.]
MSSDSFHPSERPSDPPESKGNGTDAQRRVLELELIKIRNEASAARLEARAAEIELIIQQLESTTPGKAETTTASGVPINPPHIDSAKPETHFDSWTEVRSSAGFFSAHDALSIPSAESRSAGIELMKAAEDAQPISRVDPSEPKVRRPRFLDLKEDPDQQEPDEKAGESSSHDSSSLQAFPLIVDESEISQPVLTGAVAIDSLEEEEEQPRRARPAAWLASAIAHVLILMVLGLIGLQTQRPKDQVALSGSTAEANEVSMETFEIESSEPETEPNEQTPSETEYEISPIGELAVTEFKLDAPPAPPSPAAQAISSATMKSSAAMSLKSDSKAKIQFCGVEGGGNHFVYLVDSSASMGDGFESARAELLSSIEILKPDQRFYVVFFDADSDFMRLQDVNKDETRSVYATKENKQKLRRWAMRISMDRGKAPYEPLRFALNLKPDVVFLLSDGEFPQGIEDLLTEENLVKNLFGESHPISIIHTIGYHSKEGESRMRRIAAKNKGQYRYVPKP